MEYSKNMNNTNCSAFRFGDIVHTPVKLQQGGWKHAVAAKSRGTIIAVTDRGFGYRTYTVDWDNSWGGSAQITTVANAHTVLQLLAAGAR